MLVVHVTSHIKGGEFGALVKELFKKLFGSKSELKTFYKSFKNKQGKFKLHNIKYTNIKSLKEERITP